MSLTQYLKQELNRLARTPTMAKLLERSDRRRARGGGVSRAAVEAVLSHVLWVTWRQRAGSRLTVAGYRATGGIAQAIATTAEQVYTALDKDGQDAVRRMLPRLVRVGEDSADTARCCSAASAPQA